MFFFNILRLILIEYLSLFWLRILRNSVFYLILRLSILHTIIVFDIINRLLTFILALNILTRLLNYRSSLKNCILKNWSLVLNRLSLWNYLGGGLYRGVLNRRLLNYRRLLKSKGLIIRLKFRRTNWLRQGLYLWLRLLKPLRDKIQHFLEAVKLFVQNNGVHCFILFLVNSAA